MMYLGKEFNDNPEIPVSFHDEYMQEARDLLEFCEHKYTDHGLDVIYYTWKANKGWLWDLFSRSQYWNGKGQIVISHDFVRKVDREEVDNFFYWATDYLWKEYRAGRFDGYQNFTEMRRDLGNIEFDRLASEEFAAVINNYYPDVKAVAGQKCSRIMGKVFKVVGLDKADEYLQKFTKFADAINPLTVKRHTILSINPIDYWTMSFGHKWNSCHTIDCNGNRDDGDVSGYGGCYCSGTESYMLDGSSVIFYTVDASYNGNRFELEDKVVRCVFNLGEDKFIQGRVYPVCESPEAKSTGKEIREIVQRLICEAADVPNMWSQFEMGKVSYGSVIDKGTNYKDYYHYPNVGISYWKGDGREEVNKAPITIGHLPICPSCGEEHREENTLTCGVCNGRCYRCAECGEYVDEDDVTNVNGEYYCRDCVSWCEYHQEYELTSENEYRFVYGYGDVCLDAIENSGDFVEVEDPRQWCSAYMFINDVFKTEDGLYFRLKANMIAAGYDENGHKVEKEDEKEIA